MKSDPASAIQDYQVFGEHGEVNPSITDSSTYTFLDPDTLEEHFAHGADARLVVDNTFSPLILSPAKLGADVVVHSLTKFVNGTSDCVAGVVCADREFVGTLTAVNSGL